MINDPTETAKHVDEKLQMLVTTLFSGKQTEVFDANALRVISLTKVILEVPSIAIRLNRDGYGYTKIAVEYGPEFIHAMRSLPVRSLVNEVVRLSANAKTLLVDDAEHKFTPGLLDLELITNKHPRAGQWKTNDYQVYKSLVEQTKVKSSPNRAGTARPHAMWKWKHMIKKMAILGERIADEEESENTDGTDSVELYPDMETLVELHLVY